MNYTSIKVVLKQHELGALIDMMSVVMYLAGTDGVKSRLVTCLMQGLYCQLRTRALQNRVQYKISIPFPEALAFQEYWTGQPMCSIVSGELINRIIAIVDQKAASVITV